MKGGKNERDIKSMQFKLLAKPDDLIRSLTMHMDKMFKKIFFTKKDIPTNYPRLISFFVQEDTNEKNKIFNFNPWNDFNAWFCYRMQ